MENAVSTAAKFTAMNAVGAIAGEIGFLYSGGHWVYGSMLSGAMAFPGFRMVDDVWRGRLSGILTYGNDVVDGAYTYLLFGAAFKVLGGLWSRISARWTRLKLPLGCFVAGTLVSAGSGEQVAIENIRLGDRVETTSSHPRTRVPHSWMAAYLRLATDDGTGRVFHIGLLRPKTWFAAQGVSAPGDELFLELGELGATGRAVIQRIDESPHIGEGNGRLVLMTATHASNDVYELSFVEGGEPLRGTGGHPLYSLDRDDWVRVRDLQVGERLQTAEGAVSVEALEKVRGEHRVYNLEVEGDHEYLVGEAGVRAHNELPCSIPSNRGGAFTRWFDDLSPEQLDDIWTNPKLRQTIEDRIRHPGGVHEWLMAGRAPTFKRWGLGMGDIKSLRSLSTHCY